MNDAKSPAWSNIMEPAPSSITRLLHQSQQGDRAAFDELIPVVYDQLCRLASERQGHILRTTELKLTKAWLYRELSSPSPGSAV
jgi:hypothetical protein